MDTTAAATATKKAIRVVVNTNNNNSITTYNKYIPSLSHRLYYMLASSRTTP